MRSRCGGLTILVVLAAGCTVQVDPVGRPCNAAHPCGPGTVCSPVTLHCVLPGSDVPITPVDGPLAELSVADRTATETPRADGPRDGKQPPDVRAPDGPRPDKLPLDKLPLDKVPPCAGLTCPLGCNVPANRCNRLGPSNLPLSLRSPLQAGSTAIVSGQTLQLDTTSGQVMLNGSELRAAGSPGSSVSGVYWSTTGQGGNLPELAIFGFGSLTLQGGGMLTIVGARACLIFGAGDVTIQGTVIAPPGRPTAGPGGFDGGAANSGAPVCSGGEGKAGSIGPGTCSPQCESGGGGGGRKASGGLGGCPAGNTNGSGAGGGSNGNPSLVPLYGGCGGGGGGGTSAGKGGGGGGALQISTSGTLSISSNGVINMRGAGGEKGYVSDYQGGGGGGSGGAILLEGAIVTVQGTLAANGGGGGGVTNGQDGQPSANAASGGNSGTYLGGGGPGGALSAEAGGGGEGGTKNDGGGGGGAAGRIAVSSPSRTLTGAVSPAPTTSSSVATW
jgi:hypothetical protein